MLLTTIGNTIYHTMLPTNILAASILTSLGGADYTPLADYSNCWTDSAGTLPCAKDAVVGRIASTVGSWVATQATEGFKPILRDKFSYAPITSSTTGEVWTFTGTPIAGRAGIRIDESGEKYFDCSGTSGNFATSPDSVAASITGNGTWVVEAQLPDWTPAAVSGLLTKLGGGVGEFGIQVAGGGQLMLTWTIAGVAKTASSTAAVGEVDGTKCAFKVVKTSGVKVQFYKASDFNRATKTGTWVQIGVDVAATDADATDSGNAVLIGTGYPSVNFMSGRVYYAAAWANLTGEGTPAFEFNPQRDSTNFPMNPYLDYDGTNDWLETNIAPGSYDAGYLCGGWTQMEAIGQANVMFGSSGPTGVRGYRFIINATGNVEVGRIDAVSGTFTSGPAISSFRAFVADTEVEISRAVSGVNGVDGIVGTATRTWNGSTQVALLGVQNTVESGVTVGAAFMQGSMFSQIWLPTIPTDEQQAILRAYCASKAGVTL